MLIYLFGCVTSQSWHEGSLLWHVGSFVAARGLFVAACGLLSSCGAQALEHAGSVVAARGLSCAAACWILVSRPGIEPMSPCTERQILNHWTTREVPSQSWLVNAAPIKPKRLEFKELLGW